jgi:hypothetical protein
MASSGMNRMMVFEILPDFYTSKKEASMLSQLLKDRSTHPPTLQRSDWHYTDPTTSVAPQKRR